jgi:hypothetical protein
MYVSAQYINIISADQKLMCPIQFQPPRLGGGNKKCATKEELLKPLNWEYWWQIVYAWGREGEEEERERERESLKSEQFVHFTLCSKLFTAT